MPTLSPVKPSMAFSRSDSTGPIGSGGNQLRAMYMTLENILGRREIHNNVIMDVIEFIYYNSFVNSGARRRGQTGVVPAFLTTLAESRGMWLELLRLYMRTENFVEAVRLVEVHVKFWKPRIGDNDLSSIRLDVPLLVQLQRALDSIDGCEQLAEKLQDSLDELKMTLRIIGDRMIVE